LHPGYNESVKLYLFCQRLVGSSEDIETGASTPDSKMTKHIAKSFRASLERLESGVRWVIIRVPLDVPRIWGTRARLKVRGEINGFPFRTSLFPTGNGRHMMLVNKQMQAGANAAPGSVAQFRLEPDTGPRIAIVPAELKRAFGGDRLLRRWFARLNYSARKEIADWITQVKSAGARDRRAQQIAERLLATMEAEQELPPILQVAFARNTRAREGWDRMSLSRRRMHLFGIFYYRSPEARARRVAKLIQDAEGLAEKKLR
jgi:uncharacterized protein YdeI (YjbR/CyaY-like superfamily)